MEQAAVLITRRNQPVYFNRGMIAESGILPPGMQLLRDTYSFKPIATKKAVTEGKNGRESHIFRVTGLFQEGDKQNANGRIYPTSILRKAVEDLQEDLDNRRVLGEFDHPCITTDKFRVLTVEGWRDFRNIEPGDYVYSRVNGKMVKSKVLGIVDKPYSGKVYNFKGRHIDVTYTPDHKIVMENRKGEQEDTKVFDIINNRKSYNKYLIPRIANWEGQDSTNYTIPGVKPNRSVNYYKNDVSKDLVLDAKLFVSFLGIYLAEGNLCSNHGVFINQIKKSSRAEIKEMLSQFPSELQWAEHKNGFYISDARLHAYLEPLGNKYIKYVPEDVKQLDPMLLQELVYWFQVGDGRKGYGRNNVFTTSKQLIDDLHECHIKAGGCCYETAIEPKNDYTFAGRTILATRKKALHQLTLSQTSGIYMDDRFLKIEEQDYTGNVYCLITEHGNFYMQLNGCSYWTGNCDAKIHLDRISHVISKVWMDGKKVYGEAEILDSQPLGKCLRGLFESKIPVGISSRGVGDMEVRESSGQEYYEVLEGYSFVTWDAVAEPSVHGATLSVMESLNKQLKPLKESRNKFSPQSYEKMLLSEIDRFFGLK